MKMHKFRRMSKQPFLRLIMVLFIGAFSMTAMAESWTEKSHCVIYKNDKVIKKTNCAREISGVSRAAYMWSTSQLNIRGFGKMVIRSDSRFFSASELGNANHKTDGYYQRAYYYITDEGGEGWGRHKLNNKKAIEQWRDHKTLKIIPITSVAQYNSLQHNSDFFKSYLCYKQIKGDLEFCVRPLE